MSEPIIERKNLDPEAKATTRIRWLRYKNNIVLQQWYDCRFQSGWVDVEMTELEE